MKPSFRVMVALAFFTAWLPASAQNILTYAEALDWIMENHPVARMADAVEARGPAEAMSFAAALDPKFGVNYDRKEFDNKEYFDYGEAKVEWQSPLAVKFEGGYQLAEGDFLNPERNIPSVGQAYFAVKLPLLRGLLTDATRIGLRRGELAEDRQRATADVIRNELRYDLAVRYLELDYALRAVQLNQEIADFIAIRLQNYREYFRLGEYAAVDTLEASVYLGLQQQKVSQAMIEADLARGALAEMYWPLQATDETLVAAGPLTNIPTTFTWQSHPELQELALALTDVSLQRDLKREELKPVLDLEYYFLGDGFAVPEISSGTVFTEAYKLGIKASYPIFNRKARSGLQLGELKVIESEAKLNGKQQALQVKVNAYAQAITAYDEQLVVADQLIIQARQLLQAERDLFSLGESTQLIVNQREEAYLKALLTAAKLRFARGKSVATYRYLTATW